jgi:hypothetical protein
MDSFTSAVLTASCEFPSETNETLWMGSLSAYISRVFSLSSPCSHWSAHEQRCTQELYVRRLRAQ